MTLLDLKLSEPHTDISLKFEVRRMVNAGYAGRDMASVKAHIEELKKEGVAPPASIPMIFPVPTNNITTSSQIEVTGKKTSGEVEFVLLVDNDDMYVGVGSDHTDRQLETHDIACSKQVCPNVLATRVWRLSTVQKAWDDLVLQSWIGEHHHGETLYQQAKLKALLAPDDLIAFIRNHMPDGKLSGLVLYSGTIPLLTSISYSPYFRSQLVNPRSGETITCEYVVKTLDYLTV